MGSYPESGINTKVTISIRRMANLSRESLGKLMLVTQSAQKLRVTV